MPLKIVAEPFYRGREEKKNQKKWLDEQRLEDGYSNK
ncbi:hypothetical protein SCG7086_AG_00080 [Chlamydiales bacterium SCGC AG-110-P3]|nr:hypothetical protein SCG7086_AG_00080 [Chlamydiales bacterium SCGC AG-110-P3]